MNGEDKACSRVYNGYPVALIRRLSGLSPKEALPKGIAP